MDLHFTGATPTAEEIAAIDSVGLDAANGSKRTYLLPVLHAIQDRIGWISPGALNYASRTLEVPPAEAFGVADFYALLSTHPQPPAVVHLCDDIACKIKGSDLLCAEMEKRTGPGDRARMERLPGTAAPALDCVNAHLPPLCSPPESGTPSRPWRRRTQGRLRLRCRMRGLHSLSCMLRFRRWASPV